MKASLRIFSRYLFALLFLWPFFSCNNRHPEKELNLSGTLEMTEHDVGFPVLGRLDVLKVDEGDEVKRGELLAALDRFGQAQRDYDRQVGLLARGGGNRQAVEQAELAMQDQRALAPVTGVVLTKVHETGEIVGGNSPVLVIGDRSKLWVKVYVPEGFVNRIDMGQEAEVRFDGLEKIFKGQVTFIAPQAEFTPRNVQTPEERVTQTFAVKVTLKEAPAYLRPGVAAEVRLLLREESPP